MPAEAIQGRLSELAERFSGFERQVEADARARRVTEEAGIEAVKDGLLKLEHALGAEERARTGGQRSAQAAFDAKLSAAQSRLEELFLGQLDRVHAAVDALDDRMSLVERGFLEARARYVREMEGRSAALEQDAADLRRAVEDELAERRAAERALAARLGRVEASAAERLGRAQRLREEKCAQIARGAAEVRRARDAGHELFRQGALARVEAVRQCLAAAVRAREQADDDIVAALNHYTRALQGALSGVSRSAVQAASQL